MIQRIDKLIVKMVSKADHGIEGFVSKVEAHLSRPTRKAKRKHHHHRRARRRHASVGDLQSLETKIAESHSREAKPAPAKITKRSQSLWALLLLPFAQVITAVKLVAREFTDLVASVAKTVFRAPLRAYRAVKALLAYWASGIGRRTGKVSSFITVPFRRRAAAKAKAEAAQAVTMTPDHKSPWELFAVAGAVALLGGALVAFGDSIGIAVDVPKTSGLPGIPGGLIDGEMTPSRLVILSVLASAAIAGTVFWYRMLRDSYQREYDTAVERTQWKLVTTIAFIPGAILYFFKQYNRLTLRKFASRHVISVVTVGVAVLVATSTYGTLLYFNQKASAEAPGSGYQPPAVKLDPNDRARILARDQYGQPLKRSTLTRRDPFAPIPGDESNGPEPSPSPSPSPAPR